MSINYYWMFDTPKKQFIKLPTGTFLECHPTDVPYDGTHVGKRYGFGTIAQRAQTAFIFACDPAIVLKTIDIKIDARPGEKIVEDDYGRQFTAKEFAVLLYDNSHWEIDQVGESFC